jgi:hypothetical protein
VALHIEAAPCFDGRGKRFPNAFRSTTTADVADILGRPPTIAQDLDVPHAAKWPEGAIEKRAAERQFPLRLPPSDWTRRASAALLKEPSPWELVSPGDGPPLIGQDR